MARPTLITPLRVLILSACLVAATTSANEDQASSQQALTEQELSSTQSQPPLYEPRQRVNPFAREVHTERTHDDAAPTSQSIHLKAVMPSEHQPLANINGQVLAVGEQLNGYELLAVTSNGVQMRRADHIISIELRPTTDPQGSPDE